MSIKYRVNATLALFQNSLIFHMLKLFSRYVSVGVVNTAIHWLCFVGLLHFFGASQAISNVTAFCVAVTFSFFANAKFTFNSQATTGRYIAFVVFMGVMAMLTGLIADQLKAPPILTLVAFSAFSLIAGFIYSKFIVFRDAK
ncbi:TPA: GtrA family protein [Citrobacter koseri]|nr:GtrA family protein [Citrobacter koseri]